MSSFSRSVTAETCGPDPTARPTFEAIPGRLTEVGNLPIRRLLPRSRRRMVGAWCFLDSYGPLEFDAGKPMDVAPHPHIGLQTLSWLVEGEVHHHDSLGLEGLGKPATLNLMTAGRGIAHAEETPPQNGGRLTGVQLWVALPDRDRETFCRELGLPADAPIVLYVCSALFEGSPSEAEFVMRWVAGLRQSTHDILRRASVLIRPHPKRAREWTAFQDAHDPATIVWPRQGEAPLDAKAKGSYFDSLHHSTAIVGLNTSAELEAVIVGRPVFTILAGDQAEGQEGTIHFKYLLKDQDGFVEVAPDFDTHRQQLAAAVRGEYDAGAMRRHVERFVRPHGGTQPATPLLVSAIEDLAHSRRLHSEEAARA